MNKNELKNKILEDETSLDNIQSNFKNRNDSVLYNSIKKKLQLFESMLDQIDTIYYEKLYNQLEEIEQTIQELSTAKQDTI